MNTKFSGVGWTCKLRKKRASHFIVIPKQIILGNFLEQGIKLHSYLLYHKARNAILIMLDGKPLEESMEIPG